MLGTLLSAVGLLVAIISIFDFWRPQSLMNNYC